MPERLRNEKEKGQEGTKLKNVLLAKFYVAKKKKKS